jgi:hypothetical protein
MVSNALITRRGFLKASAVTTTALIGGGSLAGCVSETSYRAIVGEERPEALSIRELAILMKVADRVIAPAPGAPTAAEARTARRIDRELAYSDGILTDDVRAALAVVEYGPLLDLRGRRFTRLSTAEQHAYLRSCAASSWTLRRNAVSGLRFLCVFLYYTDDRTWPSIGYGGPMVERKIPEAANALEALARPVGGAQA